MLEVTVKTLDGKNRSFCVPDEITVKEFKEKIANSIDITADTQRLIFHGRVLQDDHLLNEFDVNGKVIHVVARPPPSSRATSSPTSDGSTRSSQAGAPEGGRDNHSFVLGSFTVPMDATDPQHVQNVVQNVMSGMGDLGRNARVTTRSSADGSSVDVHINLGNLSVPAIPSEAQNRLNVAQRMIRRANRLLDRLQHDETENSASPMETSPSASTPDGEDTSPTPSNNTTESMETGDSPPGAEASQTGETSAQPLPSSSTSDGTPAPQPAHPPPSRLADLLGEVSSLNERVQPYLQQVRDMSQEDPTFGEGQDAERTRAQRVCNVVMETLHYISHAYHNISDMTLDLSAPAPRALRAPAPGPTHTAIVQQAIPVSAHINISRGGSPGMARRNPPDNVNTTPSSVPGMPTATTGTTAGATTGTTAGAPTASATTASLQPPHFQGLPPHLAGLQGIPLHMQGAPIPGLNLNIPGLNFGGMPGMGGQNPLVFMEVGPRAVTINSISAHLVSSANVSTTATMSQASSSTAGPQGNNNNTTGTQTAGAAPQMASTGTSTSANVSTSTSANAATNTSSSDSSSTATQTGARPWGATFMLPGSQLMPPGMLMMPGNLGPDPHLQCYSRHFLAQRAAAAARPATMQGIHMGMPSGPPPANLPPQDQLIRNLVFNIVDSFLRQTNGEQGDRAAGSTASTSTSSSASASSTTSSATTSAPSSTLGGTASRTPANAAPPPPFDSHPVRLNFESLSRGGRMAGPNLMPRQLMDLLQGAARPPTAGPRPAAPAAAPGGGRPAGTEITDEVFTQLVQGISTHMAQAALGQQPNGSIADFLNTLGQNFNIPQGEGLLTDTFNVVAQNLTFPDFMAVFYGQSEPLRRLRQPLQAFVRERILRNNPPTESHINEAVKRLIDEMQPDVTAACADFQGRENISLVATIKEFARQQLIGIITFIMSETDDARFGADLKAKVQAAIREFVGLMRHCLAGGDADLHRFIQSRIRTISQDINPMIQQWMINITSQEVNRILPTSTMTAEQLNKYIWRKDREHSPSSSMSDYMSADSDVDSPSRSQAQGSEQRDVDPRSEVEGPVQVGRPRIPPALLATVVPSAGGEASPSVVLGSESWHQVVPQEWIPVIAGDVERQRQEPVAQQPLSDAYISGMPAKRRKLMGQKPAEEQVWSAGTAVPAMLQRAVNAAAVQPSTSHNALMKDTHDTPALHNAFTDEVTKSVQRRLDTDSDYAPIKFPNTEKYFKK